MISPSSFRITAVASLALACWIAPHLSFAALPPDIAAEIKEKYGEDVASAAAESIGESPDESVVSGNLPKNVLDAMHAQSQDIDKALPFGMGKSLEGLAKSGKLPNAATAISNVLGYHGKETTGNANNGIVEFSTASVQAESDLFVSAYRFYSELKKKDARRLHNNYYTSPIQEKAEFNTYEMALRAAHGNPYLALKTLLMFGQDNDADGLNNSNARARILREIGRSKASTLYL